MGKEKESDGIDSAEKIVSVLREHVFEYPDPPSNTPEGYIELNSLPCEMEVNQQNRVYEPTRRIFKR